MGFPLEEPDINGILAGLSIYSPKTYLSRRKNLSQRPEEKTRSKRYCLAVVITTMSLFLSCMGFIVCWFAFAVFKKMFWKVLSHGWHQGANNSLRNLNTIWSYCLNSQTYFLNLNFFQPLILLKKKKKTNLVKSGLKHVENMPYLFINSFIEQLFIEECICASFCFRPMLSQ